MDIIEALLSEKEFWRKGKKEEAYVSDCLKLDMELSGLRPSDILANDWEVTENPNTITVTVTLTDICKAMWAIRDNLYPNGYAQSVDFFNTLIRQQKED